MTIINIVVVVVQSISQLARVVTYVRANYVDAMQQQI